MGYGDDNVSSSKHLNVMFRGKKIAAEGGGGSCSIVLIHGNRTSCRPILSVIILTVIKQMGHIYYSHIYFVCLRNMYLQSWASP